MKISFVIPCYNSSKNIGVVIGEIEDTVRTRAEYDYEIILVNDYSKDNTAEIINSFAKNNKKIKAISLAKNFGQPSALLAGFSYVTGDYIITSDDDGQTPVCQIFEFIDKLEEENYDIVCAKYTEREQQSSFRKFGTLINQRMSDWLIKKPKDVYVSAFMCARPFVIKEVLKYKHSYPYMAGLLLRTTQNIGNVEVKQRARHAGSSNYNLKKLFYLWLNGFTAFSIKPLRISVAVGICFSGCGFLLALITIFRKIMGAQIQAGWSSIVAIMLIVGGMTLLFLGIIGEYIGRIYMCINEAPQYVIREIMDLEEIEKEK